MVPEFMYAWNGCRTQLCLGTEAVRPSRDDTGEQDVKRCPYNAYPIVGPARDVLGRMSSRQTFSEFLTQSHPAAPTIRETSYCLIIF